MWDWDRQLLHYRHLLVNVVRQPDVIQYGPIHLTMQGVKDVLMDDVQLWTDIFTSRLYRKTLRDCDRLIFVFQVLEKKTEQHIRDVVETRRAVETLREIRNREVEFEMSIDQVDEAVNILVKHHFELSTSDLEHVQCVASAWRSLQRRALEHHQELVAVQPAFKRQLLDNLRIFRIDVNDFCADYETNGPMVQGLTPRQASDRLIIFQNRFDALWRRQTSYEGGAELFGLSMPTMTSINRIRK